MFVSKYLYNLNNQVNVAFPNFRSFSCMGTGTHIISMSLGWISTIIYFSAEHPDNNHAQSTGEKSAMNILCNGKIANF